jgi:hypothetical protein
MGYPHLDDDERPHTPQYEPPQIPGTASAAGQAPELIIPLSVQDGICAHCKNYTEADDIKISFKGTSSRHAGICVRCDARIRGEPITVSKHLRKEVDDG